MFLLGCSCGREQGPQAERQEECFSYVVSGDGVHVCHPGDIVGYGSAGSSGGEGSEGGLDTRVVECESAGGDEIDVGLQGGVERERTEGEESEGDLDTRVVHENAGKDELQSDRSAIVMYEGTEVAASEHVRPDTLLRRRGRSLC